jgi:hypothetical protein
MIFYYSNAIFGAAGASGIWFLYEISAFGGGAAPVNNVRLLMLMGMGQ